VYNFYIRCLKQIYSCFDPLFKRTVP